jgi:heme-degrading monooxygenase HmoA
VTDGAAPGPLITVFRSYRRADDDGAYEAMAEATEAAARLVPGFVEVKTFTADDGEHVTISVFDSFEAQEAWRNDPLHLEAQRLGRTTFFDAFDLAVAQIISRRRWERESADPPTR